MTKQKHSADKVFDNAVLWINKARKILANPQLPDIIAILSTRTIWVLGAGKAGLAARKMAATLASNHRPASYLCVGDALHGDIGAVQKNDCIVAFSNSGKTEEVLRVLMRARESKIITILITGNADSVLGREANYVIEYGQVDEACGLGMTPTTSFTVMSVISDALAMAVQEKTNLTSAEYASSHHAGYLGQISRKRAGITDHND